MAQEPPRQTLNAAAIDADLRKFGVGTLPEIDALGEKLLPLYMPGDGLTPIDTTKCEAALPLLVEFGGKAINAANLLAKMAEQLIAIERVSALGALQNEISRLREWASLALVDEGRCHVKRGDRVTAALRYVQAIDLDKQGAGGNQGRDELARLLDYQG